MKYILGSLVFCLGLSVHAAQVRELACDVTIEGDVNPLVVKVTTPSEDEATAVLTVVDSQKDNVEVKVAARYNGVSNKMKPGASGRYSVDVYMNKPSIFDRSRKVNVASLNFTTKFPYSATLVFMSEGKQDTDMSMVLVECVKTK